MPSNVLLVRWSGGWHEVLDHASVTEHGRQEALLSLGAQQSVFEVERIGTSELATFSRLREQTSVEYMVSAPTEAPYVGFLPGDRITVPDFSGTPEFRVVKAVSVTEDENGVVEYTPELGDTFVDCGLEERVTEQARKMTPGTLAGESRTATPAD